MSARNDTLDAQSDIQIVACVPSIRRIGRRRLDETRELDDFTQEVLLLAYANRAQVRDPERASHWVNVIARNTAVKWNQRRTPIPKGMLPDLPDRHVDAPNGDTDELWSRLVDALRSLDPATQELLRAYYLDGVGCGDLCDRYDVSYKTLSSRLARARTRVRRRASRLVGGVVGMLALRARESSACGISVAIHLALGLGMFAVWQHDAPDAETRAARSEGFRPVPGGFGVIDDPDVFAPTYAQGLTVEIAMVLSDLPKVGESWVVFAKPGVVHLVLRGPSLTQSEYEKAQPDGSYELTPTHGPAAVPAADFYPYQQSDQFHEIRRAEHTADFRIRFVIGGYEPVVLEGVSPIRGAVVPDVYVVFERLAGSVFGRVVNRRNAACRVCSRTDGYATRLWLADMASHRYRDRWERAVHLGGRFVGAAQSRHP
jgi:RNA polymerase sigma-70 factor (ECF subfamily)